MSKRRLPPYVQRVRTKSGVRYRGWATLPDGRRWYGPRRLTPQEAHADAVRVRGAPAIPDFGGDVETRAKQWLEAAATTLTPATIEFYQGKLATIYRTIPKTLPLERVTPAVLRQFVTEAQEAELSACTIQHCRRTLNRLFVWCTRRGFAANNPVSMLDWPRPRQHRPDVFTEPELRGLLASIVDPFAHDLAVFLAYSSLRRSEAARCELHHIDRENGVLWIRGKTGDEHHLLTKEASESSERLAEGRDGPFLIAGATEAARCERIAETFRTWQRKLKEPRFHPHALRHSVATIMLRNGASPATVQRFLRHKSYAMTQRYVHMVAEDVRGAMGTLRLVGGAEDEKAAHG